MKVSPVNIWRHLTGGGRPVDFLCWLAAQWTLYQDSYDCHMVNRTMDDVDLLERDKRQHYRESFNHWLHQRHAVDL